MDSIKIVRNDFDSFFEVPFVIYPGTPFVSIFKSDLKRFLNWRKNPLFKSEQDLAYFTAFREGKPVGRITAHLHQASNERHRVRQCFFGFFDCENNLETARALTDAAASFGKERGMLELIGNMNMTAMQLMGIMSEGQGEPVYSDQIYSPPYLGPHLELLGFERFFPMTTFEVDLAAYIPGSLLSQESRKRFKETGVRVQSLEKMKINEALQHAREILNDSFDENPFFVPLTEDEFMFQAKDLSLVVDRRITTFAYKDNRPVGVLICIPDLNPLLHSCQSRFSAWLPWHYFKFKRTCKDAVVVFSGICADMRERGVAAEVFDHTLCQLKNAGYEKLGITWIADVNKASLRQMEKVGARKLHRLYLYKRTLV